jgi:uncharacterized protein
MQKLIIWSITDGNAGMVSQADGLATALDKNFVKKTCKIIPWLRFFPVWIKSRMLKTFMVNKENFHRPWPDVVIGTGSSSIPALRWLKRKSPRTFIIFIQNPGILQARFFDLVIATKYKPSRTKNSLNTEFALHKLSATILKLHKEKFAHIFKNKPKPWRSIVIGGKAPTYNFGTSEMLKLIEQIKKIVHLDGSVFITTSRRTGNSNIKLMERCFQSFGNKVYIYKYNDSTPQKNPYIGMLANSDELYITEDSVSMISEACYTGKPVFLLNLHNFNRSSIKKFTDHLLQKNRISYDITKPYPPKIAHINDKEMDKIILTVKNRVSEYFRNQT